MSTPSRADRPTARLARLRTARWTVVAGVVVSLASGLVLALAAEDRPIRVIGVLVLAVGVVQALSLPALFRVQLLDRQRRRRRSAISADVAARPDDRPPHRRPRPGRGGTASQDRRTAPAGPPRR
jgi:uncharacterized membrane protein YfcA